MDTRELNQPEKTALIESLMVRKGRIMNLISDAADDQDINKVKVLANDHEVCSILIKMIADGGRLVVVM